METLRNDITDKQKETCAVIVMRDAVAEIAKQENLSYDEAMVKFASSRVYEALFDYETGIWKESPLYIFDLYEKYGHN